MRPVVIFSLFILVITITGVHAQTIYVKSVNGDKAQFPLNGIRKITFSSGNATINKTDNTREEYFLNGLRNFHFFDVVSIIKPESELIKAIRIYPNPATTHVNIDLPGAGNVQIINLNGTVMLKSRAVSSGTSSIDIVHLPKGIYLCCYTNGISNKTVKIIKQ